MGNPEAIISQVPNPESSARTRAPAMSSAEKSPVDTRRLSVRSSRATLRSKRGAVTRKVPSSIWVRTASSRDGHAPQHPCVVEGLPPQVGHKVAALVP